jgi:rhodanese-related sulfurtransferase
MSLQVLRNYLQQVNEDWNYITPLDYYNKYYLSKKDDHVLIDLRRIEDFNKIHIKGAINIFWLNILDDDIINKLPKNKIIFLICYVGHTSSQVMTLLKLLGFKVVSIKYGYGISPVKGIPVAGWLNYGLPVYPDIF